MRSYQIERFSIFELKFGINFSSPRPTTPSSPFTRYHPPPLSLHISLLFKNFLFPSFWQLFFHRTNSWQVTCGIPGPPKLLVFYDFFFFVTPFLKSTNLFTINPRLLRSSTSNLYWGNFFIITMIFKKDLIWQLFTYILY